MLAFLHPLWLLFLAGIGIPVLIHMLTRPRPRRIALPTVAFLFESAGGRQALDRLRTFLTLLLRALALAALVLAFTRPQWRSGHASTADQEGERAAILIDASLSMAATRSGVALFEDATAQAADLLRDLPDGSELAVIMIRAEPVSVLPAISRNRAALHEGLRGAEVSMERGDPVAALALADELLDGRGRVYVFSDCQRSNWAAVDLSAHPGLQVVLRPVSEEAVANCGLTDVRCHPARPVSGEAIAVEATVFNAGPREQQRILRCEGLGSSLEQRLTLPPYSSGRVRFLGRAPAAGEAVVTVSQEADALVADDRRSLVVEVDAGTDVLLLSDSDPRDSRTAAAFISQALRPGGDASGFALRHADGRAVAAGSLRRADVLVLVPPVHLAGDILEELCARVCEGGADCLVVLGEGAPELLGALAGASGGAWQAPFELGKVDPGSARLRDPSRFRGPLAVLAEAGRGGLEDIAIERHWRSGEAAQGSELYLDYDNGSVALAGSAAGRGRVLWWNLPADTHGGDLVGHPLFPVLLHEGLRSLRTGQAREAAPIGRAWRLSLDLPAGGGELRLLADDDNARPVTLVAAGRPALLELPAVDRPGIRRLTQGESVVARIAYNPAFEETDTRRVGVDSLLVGEGAAPVSIAGDHAAMLAAGRERELWPTLITVAIGAFLAEMALLALWQRRPTAARLAGRAGNAGRGKAAA